MKMFTYLFALLLITASCGDDDDGTSSIIDSSTPPDVEGMNYVKSNRSFDDTYNALKSALQANENITIIAEVDHQENAASAGLELNPTRVIFFGNPALGTPLMNIAQQTGIDLPQRMLVYQDDNNDVYIGYNSTGYLQSRHSFGEVETLPQIAMALANFAGNAGDDSVINPSVNVTIENDGVVTDMSQRDFVTTYDALRDAIDSNPNLQIIAALNHQANAQSVDLDLPPTRVIIFGNPNLGTPLMQDAQTAALDLPQRMLVSQNDLGIVQVSYIDPNFIARRHGITGNTEVIATISGALRNLSNTATGN
ncbi:DUF302 domain-containing protein [Dokdonia sinensis]|uniref:DUF302 domain-containing protein n=1 Tax=Dokdonia sinensis TaxID=2479847 RepID=A0A3M0G6D8_9FLAO|nr:DUF302 domain-containing protein [Dokdonia sinensis]RMB60485.1 DUF302 domain-containing protein [Dokdonia sinensis]